MTGPVIADHRWDRLIAEHQAALAERAAAARDPLSPVGRYLYGLVGGCAGVFGLALLGMSAWHLREAYLYRERTGEGMLFAQALYLAAPGALLALAGGLCLLNASRGASPMSVLLLRMAAASLGLAIVGTWCLGVWVESQSGCIGPCG